MNLNSYLKLVCNTPWAIPRETHEVIVDKYMNGSAAMSNGAASGSVPMEMMDGIAVIRVSGVLMKSAGWIGESSYLDIRSQMKAALDDRSVKSILLVIDSPGGAVDGVQETAELIRSADAVKPVYAFSDGCMTSAAYYIGSAARSIAASEMSIIGSIGVIMAHVDMSRMAEDAGIKITYIASGKYKAIGNSFEPLGTDAKDYFQAMVDRTCAIFVRDVATYRGVTIDDAFKMSDGARVYMASDALEAGLIDRISGLDDFMNTILKGEEFKMDLMKLKEDHPELYSEVMNLGAVQASGDMQSRIDAAETAQADRIMAIVGRVFGSDAKDRLHGLISAGVTPEQLDAIGAAFPGAVSGKNGEKTSRESVLQAIVSATPQAAGSANVPEASGQPSEQTRRKELSDAIAAAANSKP